jgi:hypothetical protein
VNAFRAGVCGLFSVEHGSIKGLIKCIHSVYEPCTPPRTTNSRFPLLPPPFEPLGRNLVSRGVGIDRLLAFVVKRVQLQQPKIWVSSAGTLAKARAGIPGRIELH